MAFAADPAFKDYTVTPVFTGPNHKLVPQENSSPMMDQARVQALKGKVNFAGHYILHRLGCGGSAICGEVLDAQTGEVVGGLPNAYDGSTFGMVFQPDSSLIIVSGITLDGEAPWDLQMRNPRLPDRAAGGYAQRAAIAHAVYAPDMGRPVEVSGDNEKALVTWLTKRLGAPVEYAEYAKEGHGYYKYENRLDWAKRVLAHLDKTIGDGRAAPVAVN